MINAAEALKISNFSPIKLHIKEIETGIIDRAHEGFDTYHHFRVFDNISVIETIGNYLKENGYHYTVSDNKMSISWGKKGG